jgi:hypothetical protein
MMRKLITIIAAMSLILTCASSSWALVDDFNENGYNNAIPYYGFMNWTVTDASVDLIGADPFDYFPTYGMYVDTVGSPDGNDLETSGEITANVDLNPGNYVLSYDLAGSQRSKVDAGTVTVSVDSSVVATHNLKWDDPFMTFTYAFSISSAKTVPISFTGSGASNIGPLLDNVEVGIIPAPGAVLLGGIGVALVGWMRKRRTL